MPNWVPMRMSSHATIRRTPNSTEDRAPLAVVPEGNSRARPTAAPASLPSTVMIAPRGAKKPPMRRPGSTARPSPTHVAVSPTVPIATSESQERLPSGSTPPGPGCRVCTTSRASSPCPTART